MGGIHDEGEMQGWGSLQHRLDAMDHFSDLGRDPAAALSLSDGELVFAEPRANRAFGMAALANSSVFGCSDLQAGLVATIVGRERHHDARPGYFYYARRLTALESIVVARGLIAKDVIERRFAEFTCCLHRHDHDDDHEHGHEH